MRPPLIVTRSSSCICDPQTPPPSLVRPHIPFGRMSDDIFNDSPQPSPPDYTQNISPDDLKSAIQQVLQVDEDLSKVGETVSLVFPNVELAKSHRQELDKAILTCQQSFFDYLSASRGSATKLRTAIQGFVGDIIPLLAMKDLPPDELLAEVRSASDYISTLTEQEKRQVTLESDRMKGDLDRLRSRLEAAKSQITELKLAPDANQAMACQHIHQDHSCNKQSKSRMSLSHLWRATGFSNNKSGKTKSSDHFDEHGPSHLSNPSTLDMKHKNSPDKLGASTTELHEQNHILKERETQIATIINDWDGIVLKSGYFPLIWEKLHDDACELVRYVSQNDRSLLTGDVALRERIVKGSEMYKVIAQTLDYYTLQVHVRSRAGSPTP